jgi:predicted Zn-dependent protease
LAAANLLNIAKATQFPPAYLLLAVANMEAEEWENALTVLDILHSIEPDLPEANLLKGFIHGYFNRFGEGKGCLQAAVKKAPRLRLAWIALIEMAMAEGSNHEAARFLTEALRVDPHHMDLLRSQLGLLLDPSPRLQYERLPLPCPLEAFMQGDTP